MTIKRKPNEASRLPNPSPDSKESYRQFASQWRERKQDKEAYLAMLEAERLEASEGWHNSAQDTIWAMIEGKG